MGEGTRKVREIEGRATCVFERNQTRGKPTRQVSVTQKGQDPTWGKTKMGGTGRTCEKLLRKPRSAGYLVR